MQLTYHLTKACNLRCQYCYYSDFGAPRMPFATAIQAADQIIALGHEHLGVTFFGGEPLLCKNLIQQLVPELKARCASRNVGVNFKIPTNGLLLDEPFLEFCEEHGIFISLSIDGDEQAHGDRVRPDGTSSYSQVERAFHLLASNATTFATYSVVTPRNVARLAGSIECLYQRGARILITALDYGAPWTRKELRILEKQYKVLAEFYVNETLAKRHFYLSAFDAKILAHSRPDHGEDTVCRIGTNQFSVAPDGTYFPCIQFVDKPEFTVGHVSKGIDIERCRTLYQRSAPSDPSCQHCGILDRCSHHCACVSFQSTGTLDGIPPLVCEHERLLTPIADQVARRLFRQRAPLFINKQYNPAYDMLRTVEEIIRQNGKESSNETVTSETVTGKL